VWYDFDTDDRDVATAALLLYVVWRSRDRARFKITPEIWGQIERFTKASAKRATTLPLFIEALKPRLACATLAPAAMRVGLGGVPVLVEDPDDGTFVAVRGDVGGREFLTDVLRDCAPRRVLDALYRETAWVVLLVRDRLERERPAESRIVAATATQHDEVRDGDE